MTFLNREQWQARFDSGGCTRAEYDEAMAIGDIVEVEVEAINAEPLLDFDDFIEPLPEGEDDGAA